MKHLLILFAFFFIFSSLSYAQWTVLHEEDFSNPSFTTQLTGVSGFSAAGLTLSADYGSSGQIGDECANTNSFSYGGYIAFQHSLTAGETYRLKVSGRANSVGKAIKFTYGSTLNYGPPYGENLIQGFVIMDNLFLTTPATVHTSSTFTVSTTGTYWLIVERDNGSPGGWVQLDDFTLEQSSSGGGSQPTINFATDSLSIEPGGSVQVCATTSAAPSQTLNVGVDIGAVSSPHFSTFNSATLNFPTGSAVQQCFTLQASSDTLTVDSSYTFHLDTAYAGVDSLLIVTVAGYEPPQPPPPSTTFSIDTISATAGDTISVCIDISSAPDSSITANLDTLGSTGVHFDGLNFPYSLIFPANDTSSQCIDLILSDSILLDTQIYQLVIDSPANADTLLLMVYGADSTGTGNDPDPSLIPPDELVVNMIAQPIPGTDTVRIRWAPGDYESWEWANAYGYRLQRMIMSDSGATLTSTEIAQSIVVLDSFLAPLPEDDWEDFVDSNEVAGLAAGALYGEGFSLDTLNVGNIFEAYNVNQEKQNRFGFGLFAADRSFEVAKAMGLAFEDSGLDQSKVYYYRLYFNNVPDSVSANRGVVSINLNGYVAPPAPSGLVARPGDLKANLAWNRGDLDSHYSNFDVYRSENSGQTFSKVNDLPIVYTTSTGPDSEYMYFSDSLEQNDVLYVYKLRGNTPFEIPGAFSDTIHVYGRTAPLATTPYIRKVWEKQTGEMEVIWEFPATLNNQVSHFDLCRSSTHDGEFVKINTSPISVTTRQYLDTDALSASYYKVVAVDINDNEVPSVYKLGQLDDETPPAVPSIIDCLSDPDGIVRFRWVDNTEADLFGYRVYTCNQPDGEYTQLTSTVIRDTLFYEQFNLNTLSENVYMKVSALDFRQNQSDYSDACVVELPDIVPPSPPNIVKITPQLGSVRVEWECSDSRDVEIHELDRKPADGFVWETLWSADSSGLLVYEDTTATYDQNYHYRVAATDDSGNTSYSKILQGRPIDDGMREPIKNFWGVAYMLSPPTGPLPQPVNEDDLIYGRGIAGLAWEYPLYPNLHSFLIYREVQGQMRPFKTVFPNDVNLTQQQLEDKLDEFGNYGTYSSLYTPTDELFYYRDASLRGGRAYKYRIVARYLDGGVSPMSRSVTISY